MRLRIHAGVGALGLLLLLGSGGPGDAGIGRWTAFGPERGAIRALAVDPGAPGSLYGLSGPGLVFRSDDGGLSWRWAGRGLEGVGVAGLAADPVRPGRAFAVSSSGKLFRTDNRGAGWQPLGSVPGAVKAVAAIGSGTVFLLGTGGKVWQSLDGGSSFALVLEVPGTLTRLLGDPTDGRVAYLPVFTNLGQRREPWRTTDGGATWSPLAPPIPQADTAVLAVAATRPSTLYVRSGDALFSSRDRGASWQALGLRPVTTGTVLAADPVVRDTLYASVGAQVGLWVSRDAGKSWIAGGTGLPNGRLLDLAVDPDSRQVFALTEPGVVYRAELGAGRFRAGSTRQLLALAARFLRFDPADSEKFYLLIEPAQVGAGAGILWQSTDRGRAWRPFAGALSAAVREIYDLVPDPQHGGRLYAPTRAGLFRSLDGGESWTALGIPSRTFAIADRGVLLAGDCGIQRSEDEGLSWQYAIPCRTTGSDPIDPADDREWKIDSLLVDPEQPATIYAQLTKRPLGSSAPGVPSLYRSRDGGQSFQEAIFGQTLVAVGAVRPGTVYAAQADGLLYSEDAGNSWRRTSRLGLAAGLKGLAVDAVRLNVLYALYANRGILRSNDNGATWQPINDGLPTGQADRLAAHPNLQGYLYALSGNGGLFGGQF
jgi:photosystem II stability/assembly factor-like uncharacterized protein